MQKNVSDTIKISARETSFTTQRSRARARAQDDDGPSRRRRFYFYVFRRARYTRIVYTNAILLRILCSGGGACDRTVAEESCSTGANNKWDRVECSTVLRAHVYLSIPCNAFVCVTEIKLKIFTHTHKINHIILFIDDT